MRFARPGVIALWLLLLVPFVSPLLTAAQAPSQPQPDQAQTSQPAPGDAYQLPPDKLAKAVTLNKIRLALDIGGSLWGLAVLWWLLASRAAARMGGWAERTVSKSWIQGLLFFAAFFVITTVASLPLDAIGHAVSLHYNISVQSWAGWLGDQGKGLGITLVFGTLILLLFNRIVRASPRGYWVWLWVITMPLIVLSIFISPLIIDPLFNKFEPLTNTHAALVGKLETVVAKTGTHIA